MSTLAKITLAIAFADWIVGAVLIVTAIVVGHPITGVIGLSNLVAGGLLLLFVRML